MDPDLKLAVKCLSRCTYYVTDEEDVAIKEIAEIFEDSNRVSVKILNASFGLLPVAMHQEGLQNKALPASPVAPAKMIDEIFTERLDKQIGIYVITDPERWFNDANLVRKFLNIVHQVRHNMKTVKCLVFVGSRLVTPSKLQPYMQVIRAKPMDDAEIQDHLQLCLGKMKTPPPLSADIVTACRGLNRHEVEMAIARSLTKTKNDKTNPRRIDRSILMEFKRERIKKTELLSLIKNTTKFEDIGGLDRFKEWAEMTKSAWTAEGQKFGLKPPKGVLCVGVWGCGKSLSVKALGSAWRLPVIQLELGKLRQSGVGDTEANVYKVTSYLESLAPCLAWVDEAEKSFAGSHSSSYSDAGTTSRTLGILSTWHQETKADVCLALTANSLTTLPTEFTNRIEDRFFFGLPSESDRVAVLKIHLKVFGHLNDEQIEAFDLLSLSKAADEMVPREMEQAVKAALRRSFFDDKEQLDEEILRDELKTKPRILTTMNAELEAVLQWVGWDDDRKEGIRAKFASSQQTDNTMKVILNGN